MVFLLGVLRRTRMENESDQSPDMMRRKIQGLFRSFHDPRQSLFEKMVAMLFGLAAANLCVVFLVQGGYEFSVGPILVHARYVLKSLLLCLALALAKAWLDGRRTGLSVSESLRSPVLLFLITILIYSLNGRTIWSGDTIPARYLPLSLIWELDFDLDEFPFLYESKLPYFLTVSLGHVVSAYPPWVGVLALPVYLGPALLGVDPTSLLMEDLEKRAAMLITAVSVVVLFFALRRVTLQKTAWFIAVIYAFGTSSFSTSSQALWQHGPVQLFLALTIFWFVKGLENPRFLAYSGFALGCVVILRPLNLIVALPLVAYIVHKHRDQLVGFLLAGVPPLLLFMAYNTVYFGSPFTTGFGGGVMTPSAVISTRLSSSFNTPILAGIAGVLVSPGRGLLVYSPVFVFSVVGMMVAWREPRYLYLRYLSVAPLLSLIIVSKWIGWWGGDCYGPRLLADVTPILCFLLYPAVDYYEGKKAVKYALIGLAALSIGMHAIGAGARADEKSWTEHYEVGLHPERLWSWRDSPPMYYGKQLLGKVKETLSSTGE